MSAASKGVRRTRFVAAALVASAVAVGSALSASPVQADEPGETTVGYLLVQQALGHLAHDTTSLGIEIATEKIDDALATVEQDGVDVAELQRARDALAAGQVRKGEDLLQSSISEAVSRLGPAVGEETGTKIVLGPQPGRSGLTGTDTAVLMISMLTLILGVGLAWFFRPRDNIDALRRRLNPLAARHDGGSSDGSPEEAS